MAYEKHNWSCGETVTADLLNHMEDGIEGAEPGYECTETEVELFNGSAETVKFLNGGYVSDAFQMSRDLTADEIKVVFDGTEYTAQRVDFYGTIYYGATYRGEFNWSSNIPFCIYDVSGNTAKLATENASTHDVKIIAPSLTADVTSCFKEAVTSVFNEVHTEKLNVIPVTTASDGKASCDISYDDVEGLFDKFVKGDLVVLNITRADSVHGICPVNRIDYSPKDTQYGIPAQYVIRASGIFGADSLNVYIGFIELFFKENGEKGGQLDPVVLNPNT